MPKVFDTIVAGLGIMGSSAAYHFAKRGQKVLGLEQYEPAHAHGSSHGRSRIIRQAYYNGELYVPLIKHAYKLWREIEHESEEKLLTVTGGIMLSPKDGNLVLGSKRSAELHGISFEHLDSKEFRDRFPLFQIPDHFEAIVEHEAGFLDAERCVLAYQRCASLTGADSRFKTKLVNWRINGESSGVEVETSAGKFSAQTLVLASGAWTPELLPDLNLPLTVSRNVLYWFMPQGDLKAFEPRKFPIYILHADEGKNIYGFPAQGDPSEGVKVAFGNDPTTCNPHTISREVSPVEIEVMRERLNRFLPALNGKFIRATTCMYASTPDERFILDYHPATKCVLIASPCSGHGFKFGSAIGEMLFELAQGSRNEMIEQFSLINR